MRAGVPVVDISADFRLKDAAEYSEWYGGEHPAPDLLPQAVYGLPELYREAIKKAKLVANPGCYPESALLALAPAVKAGIIAPEIIIDSKSGVSGAGRGLALNLHLGEAGESVSAYGLNGHRHLPEIVQELAAMWPPVEAPRPSTPKVTFTPHLIPMTRGILSTCYAPLWPGDLPSGDAGKAALREIYEQFYTDEPFVRVVGRAAGDEADARQQHVPGLPDGGRAHRAAGRRERARQPGEGRGRPGDPEHEPDAGAARDDGARHASAVYP